MTNEIAAAMDAYKPVIAERWAQSLRNLFEDVVALRGPAMSGLANCWKFAKVARNASLRKYLTATMENGRVVSYAINEARVTEDGMVIADAVVQEWIGKIQAKMGELEDATAHYVSGTSFRISGTRGGHRVAINQEMIINVSRLGRPFNQWPSRIYVDGEFVSEAAYKKMFKAVAA